MFGFNYKWIMILTFSASKYLILVAISSCLTHSAVLQYLVSFANLAVIFQLVYVANNSISVFPAIKCY